MIFKEQQPGWRVRGFVFEAVVEALQYFLHCSPEVLKVPFRKHLFHLTKQITNGHRNLVLVKKGYHPFYIFPDLVVDIESPMRELRVYDKFEAKTRATTIES